MADLRKNYLVDEPSESRFGDISNVREMDKSNQYVAGSGNPASQNQSGDAMTYQTYVDKAVESQQPQQQSAGGAQATAPADDYIQLARDQEYGLLFDREIQLENARANAQKYARNAIEAQGFGGTGYGSTMQSGIYNQYMSQLANAQQDYSKNISNIEAQQRQDMQTEANDRFQSVTTMLSHATTQEQMDSLLESYGYMKNGKFVSEKPEGMSDDDWNQIKYYYGIYKDEINLGNGSQNTDHISELANIQYNSNGKISSMGEHFQEEIKYINYKTQNGEIEDGSIIKVTNGSNETVYLKYENGTYKVTKDENADYELEYKNGKNDWNPVKK